MAALLALGACSSEPDEAVVEERARQMAEGMAQEMAKEMMAASSDKPQEVDEAMVEERARQMAQGMAQEMANKMMEASGDRLQGVKDGGKVVCASNNSLAGFGFIDNNGNTVGFDIELCRAVAAAVLGNPDSVEFRPTTASERGPVMQSGEVDMMSRNTTWTTSRDGQWGNFTQTMFYDGQGFMVPKSLEVSGLLELKGAKVCVQQGTTTELNLQDFENQNDLDFDVLTFPDAIGAREAYQSGQCDSLTTDRSGLVSTRAGFENPDDHIILPGTISEEPLGPVVPHGDEQWYDVVKAVMAILIYAEAYGITSGNVPTTVTGDTAVDRLFGLEGSFGQETMGLSDTVAQDVIRAVGNYGEIYDRHLTPLGLVREGSRNALWSSAPCADCPKGGQVYAAPLR
jgi:general L-amino acid transport system substrate-binding protein